MTDIILYGDIAKKYGKKHSYSVSSVPEGLRALEANFKGFRNSIKENSYYKVIVDNVVISKDELNKKSIKTIKIIPVISGSGNGTAQIILGVVLIAFAWWNPYSWGVLASGGTAAGASALSATFAIGASMLLGGISQMLAGTPKISSGADAVDKNQSYLFDGPVNTTAQGNPVPLAYGQILIGSQVISAGLEVR